jgi:hypothetical protein
MSVKGAGHPPHPPHPVHVFSLTRRYPIILKWNLMCRPQGASGACGLHSMMPPMPRVCTIMVACLLCLAGCQGRTQPTAEEQHLLERLTRDPGVSISSYERDGDGHLVVATQQGDCRMTYIFKPDTPGGATLNVHCINGSSRLETAPGDPPRPLRVR